ncbi:MAG: hypothetical protein U0353_29305 [Sandaracinus sp.]
MTVSFNRRDLADTLSGTPLQRDLLDVDPALAGLGLDRALPPLDPAVDTDAERDALFDALDALDGRRDATITVVDRNGTITAAADPMRALADAAGDTALRDEVNAAIRTARLDPRVIHVGMNDDSAEREVAALRREVPVVAISDVRRGNGLDSLGVRIGAVEHSLGDRASIDRFVSKLDLPSATSRRVADLIEATQPRGRRELAELARTLAAGEHGERIPPRLVLSGHGNGEEIFGSHDDSLLDTNITELARALPRGAAQIEHLHLAACQHGWEPRMDAFREAFPRLESVWGYTGFSPSGAPAIAQQRVWERATRDGDATDLDPRDARGTRRAGEIAIWTRERGFEGLHGRELSIVDRELRALEPTLARFMLGEREPRGSTDPELVRAYGLVQEAINNPDFDEQSADYQADLREQRDQLLRLRFYASDVAPHFASTYRRDIELGYQAAGLAVPDFARLPRGEAMAAIDALAAARSTDPDARHALSLLERGLRQLDARLIPTSWL